MLELIIQSIPFPDWINETAISLGPLSVKWYGLSYIAGIALAYFYAKRVCERRDVWIADGVPSGPMLIPNKAILEDYFFYALLGIMIGGRIGSILLYDTEKYMADPLAIFKVWEGGMSFHGGMLGVGVAVLYLARKYKMSLGRIGDIAAIGAPFGLLTGRLANFINQELWGSPTDAPWGVIFRYDPDALARHPTQLYEALLEGVVLWLIIRVATHKFKALTRPGLCVGLFLLFYGLFRIWVELYRLPDAGISQFGFLQRGQMYSLPMVLGGAYIIWRALKKPPVSPKRIKEEPEAEAA
ncbi:MAG: prolipoprotein diacylglyceryl transferase [Robiginitomaculum sp.]